MMSRPSLPLLTTLAVLLTLSLTADGARCRYSPEKLPGKIEKYNRCLSIGFEPSIEGCVKVERENGKLRRNDKMKCAELEKYLMNCGHTCSADSDSDGSSFPRCYKCDESAKGVEDCTSHTCIGKCGTISYTYNSYGDWSDIVNTTKLMMCLPDSFSDETVCAIKRPYFVGSSCNGNDPYCTCNVTRCSTDRCNGNFESQCPVGEPVFNCLVNPCDFEVCDGNPDATCVPNYCGGCSAEFRDYSGNKVECDVKVNECPYREPLANCPVNPCDVFECAGNPDATCVPNYCGGCNAEFRDYSGNKVECDDKENEETSECPDGEPRWVNCFRDPCAFAKCAGNPDAICVPNYCGGCNAEFRDYSGNKVECGGKVEEETSECPDGGRRVNCAANPCEVEKCAANPDAVCFPNFCGGCNADFRDHWGNKVDCGGK